MVLESLCSCAESFILVQVGGWLFVLMVGWLVFESLYFCAESLYSCAESFILVQVGGWLADSLRLPRQNGLKSSL